MTSAASFCSSDEFAATTVGEWFANLQPPPPPALAEELRRLLANEASRPVGDVPAVCLAAGERMLAELMQSGATARGTALTLLSVDALVTYAFEAASSDPHGIDTIAANSMKRIASIGSQHSE